MIINCKYSLCKFILANFFYVQILMLILILYKLKEAFNSKCFYQHVRVSKINYFSNDMNVNLQWPEQIICQLMKKRLSLFEHIELSNKV